ncbi:MAG: hypothetical protein AAGE80_05200 [Pseudomonadota bacterium]
MRSLTISLLAAAASAVTATPAPAQMLDQPWQFNRSNRAQIAFSMRQTQGSSSSTGLVAPGDSTTIVCGGGSATATANNTCIILNNATGEILADQVSDGSQDATAVSETTTDSPADQVLTTLEGE